MTWPTRIPLPRIAGAWIVILEMGLVASISRWMAAWIPFLPSLSWVRQVHQGFMDFLAFSNGFWRWARDKGAARSIILFSSMMFVVMLHHGSLTSYMSHFTSTYLYFCIYVYVILMLFFIVICIMYANRALLKLEVW